MNDDLPDGLLADLYGIVESLRHVLNAAFSGVEIGIHAPLWDHSLMAILR